MNHSLKPWNTFGIDHNAQHIVCAEDEHNYSMPGSMQPQKDNPFLFWVKEVMYFFWKTIVAR